MEMKINDKHIKGLPKLPSNTNFPKMARGILALMEGAIKPYPPLPANYDADGPHYQRGYGWVNAQGEGEMTSWRLGTQWRITMHSPDSTSYTLGNRAPYAAFVHHHAMQPKFHRRTGWRTDLHSAMAKQELIRQVMYGAMRDAARRSGGI
jgi:hypothetical protein